MKGIEQVSEIHRAAYVKVFQSLPNQLTHIALRSPLFIGLKWAKNNSSRAMNYSLTQNLAVGL